MLTKNFVVRERRPLRPTDGWVVGKVKGRYDSLVIKEVHTGRSTDSFHPEGDRDPLFGVDQIPLEPKESGETVPGKTFVRILR